jgi:hypothetical protein
MDDVSLIAAFEAGMIPATEFPHEHHVRVAWGLARRYGPEEGLRRLIAGIRGMAVRAGRPDAYHVTITKAWFDLVASVDDLADAPELLDKSIINRYYSSDRLAQGHDRWVAPDLNPLHLPIPVPA